jgi:hypothetical protein
MDKPHVMPLPAQQAKQSATQISRTRVDRYPHLLDRWCGTGSNLSMIPILQETRRTCVGGLNFQNYEMCSSNDVSMTLRKACYYELVDTA